MKLKNLFTCTVTGLLLCTSCIKDEAPNAEADILNCILPAEMLTGTDIDYNRPYDKSLNAYPIYIEVNNGTDLTRLAPTFELTEGASIEPANGSTQNFTNSALYRNIRGQELAPHLRHQYPLSRNQKYPDVIL